jgi:hypothetical protein
MALANFYLTALRASPQKHEDRAIPRVVALDSSNVIKAISVIDDAGRERTVVKVQKERYVKTIHAVETLGEYTLQRDYENAASSPYNTGTKASIAAAGSIQASGATSNAYHVTVTAATVTDEIGLRLPAASTRKLVAFVNQTAQTLKVWASATTQTLDGSTAGVTLIPAGQFKHFYAAGTTGFVTCKGPFW